MNEGTSKESLLGKSLMAFFKEMMPGEKGKAQTDFLFQMIQYVERQVVLFDSIEDAAYEKVNDIGGKGSVKALISRVENDRKKRIN